LNALGFNYRRQVPFRNYILDFVEYRFRVVIELDGEQHGRDGNRLRDSVRDSILAREGYRVLRFWNHEIVESFDAVKETIDRVLR